MRLEYNTITTNSERSPNIAVPARLASLRNSSRIIFRLSQSGLFSFSLLHKRIASLTRRTSTRRSATFMKGTEYGTVSRYFKSKFVLVDNRRRLSGISRHVEKLVTSLSDLYSIRHITDKLTNWTHNVKIIIDKSVKDNIGKEKP